MIFVASLHNYNKKIKALAKFNISSYQKLESITCVKIRIKMNMYILQKHRLKIKPPFNFLIFHRWCIYYSALQKLLYFFVS